MANRYSDQYATTTGRAFTAGVEAVSTTISGYSSKAERVGEAHTVVAKYTCGAAAPALVATGDKLYLCPLPPGAKLLRVSGSKSADPASAAVTFDLGYSSDPNAYTQAGASAELADAADWLIEPSVGIATLDDWDDLILTVIAENLNQAATLTFAIEYTIEK